MKILVIGRRHLFNPQDVAEEYEIYKAFLELGCEAYFNNWLLEDLPNIEPDWIFIAKTFTREQEITNLKARFPKAKQAYWQPDYGRMTETESGFQNMAKMMDLYIGRMREDQPWFKQNNVPYLYWNFDVACSIFKKESGKGVLWAEPQTPYPDEVPIGFVGNWVHNPFRANILRDIQYEFPDLHITSGTQPEFEKRDNLYNVHLPSYGYKFNYLVDITKINLSIESAWQPGFWGPRTARIMAAGGFALVFRVDGGMDQVFGQNGVNVEYFSTVQEAVEKIRYFLKNDQLRQHIADTGYKFANQWLRPINRVKELYEDLHLRCSTGKDN